MPKHITKTDLLDFVEGTIEPRRGAHVRRLLVDRPKLRTRLDGMIADRAAVRALATPESPRDLVAELLAQPSMQKFVHPHRSLDRALVLDRANDRDDGAYAVQVDDAEPSMLVGPSRSDGALGATGAMVATGALGATGAMVATGARRLARPQWTRWAIAAGVLVAIGIGVRDGIGRLSGATSSPNDELAQAAGPGRSGSEGIEGSNDGRGVGAIERRRFTHDELLGGDADIHHAVPRLGAAARGLALGIGVGEVSEGVATRTATHASGGAAIMIEASDTALVVAQLRDVVDRIGAGTALVRNFSYDDAIALQRQIVGRHPGERSTMPTLLELRPPGSAESLDAQARQFVVDWVELVGASEPLRIEEHIGEQLAGPRSAAPSPSIQLELAELGYTHAIAVPAARLNEVLAALAEIPGGNAWIAPRDDRRTAVDSGVVDRGAPRGATGIRPRAGSPPASAPAPVIERWRRWDAIAGSLSPADGATEVILPISIRTTR